MNLAVDGTVNDAENFNPSNIQLTELTGDFQRGHYTLNTTDWKTINPGEIVPVLWYFQNNDSTHSITLSFGTDQHVLPPGVPAFIPSTKIPIAKAVTGTPQLIWAAYQ